MTKTVTIAVCTYQRPASLRRLLDSIDKLASPKSAIWTETIVIDNDPDQSARLTVSDWQPETGTVRYVPEPTPGISAARNRAVAECKSPLIAFVDDDETVNPGWLLALCDTLSRTGAEVAVGSVTPQSEDHTLQTHDAPSVYGLPVWTDGEQLATIASGNVLIDLPALRIDLPLFDMAFGESGGEDHLLGVRLARTGHHIIAATAAATTEWIPPSRLSAEVIKARAIRTGNTIARVDLLLSESLAERVRMTLRHVWGGRKIVLLLLSLKPGLSDDRRIYLSHRGHHGVGQLRGVLGLTDHGYSRESDDE